MVYLLIIYADEASWVTKTEAEMAPVMAEHERLEADLRKTGRYLGCGGLAPGSAAKTVHLGAGNGMVTDGPYAETKELFAGYYLVDAETIDDAIADAKRIPGFEKWAVEVRPVVDFRR